MTKRSKSRWTASENAEAGDRTAVVDTGATDFIINDACLLSRVTAEDPGGHVETLAGSLTVTAIGDLDILLRDEHGTWHPLPTIHRVLVVPNADAILYSTEAMFTQLGMRHYFDDLMRIVHPDGTRFPFQRTDGGYLIAIRFAGVRAPARALVTTHDQHYTDGVSQAALWRRLAYPHESSWRHVPNNLDGTGLPPGTTARQDLVADDAVMRGRMRALPFTQVTAPSERPAPGAAIYMDFAGPMTSSHLHKFNTYCGVVDAGSGYARAYPAK